MAHSSSAPPHICFVALEAWPVLSGDARIRHVGGAEVQQCVLAHAFVQRGYRVSMVCADYGQANVEVVDGITVHKCMTGRGRIPVVRFFHPRLTGIWGALERADADIYYQRCANARAAVVAAFSRVNRRKFVYAAACDLDLARNHTWKLFQRRGGWRDRQLYFAALKWADAIIGQHAGQAADLRRWYGREATIVPSCYQPPLGSHASRDGAVLWVSILRSGKRPDLFLEIARRLPHLRFRMVGGPPAEPHGEEFYGRIKAAAQSIPNLEFVGFVPHAEIEPEFNDARVFVNTSEFEGFPNTFLQAWSRGIPTVSFCDTGTRFEGRPVVSRACDLDDMVKILERLMRDDAHWEEAGCLARACMKAEHGPETAVAEYERVFETLGLTAATALEMGSAVPGRHMPASTE